MRQFEGDTQRALERIYSPTAFMRLSADVTRSFMSGGMAQAPHAGFSTQAQPALGPGVKIDFDQGMRGNGADDW